MIVPVACTYEIKSPFGSRKINIFGFPHNHVNILRIDNRRIDYLHICDVEKHYRYNL